MTETVYSNCGLMCLKLISEQLLHVSVNNPLKVDFSHNMMILMLHVLIMLLQTNVQCYLNILRFTQDSRH